MRNNKIPLPELVERNRAEQNEFGWEEFVKIARLPKNQRPSFKSLGHIFGRNERTVRRWLDRFDEEEK